MHSYLNDTSFVAYTCPEPMATKSLAHRENKVKRTIMCHDFNYIYHTWTAFEETKKYRNSTIFGISPFSEFWHSWFPHFSAFLCLFNLRHSILSGILVSSSILPEDMWAWRKSMKDAQHTDTHISRTCSRNGYILPTNFYWRICKWFSSRQ